MKILLAIDDSKFSEAATQAVASRTRSQDAEVCILHVVEPIHEVFTDVLYGQIPDIDAVRQAQLDHAKALVEGTAHAIQRPGMKVTTVVDEGDPKTKIIDHADAWGANLIVVGSHGRKGLERLLLGSVSAAVASHARCSVEVVRLPLNQ